VFLLQPGAWVFLQVLSWLRAYGQVQDQKRREPFFWYAKPFFWRYRYLAHAKVSTPSLPPVVILPGRLSTNVFSSAWQLPSPLWLK